jgi:hypothetical protein
VETRLRDLVGSEEPATVRRDSARRIVLQDGLDVDTSSTASAPGARLRARLSRESSFVFVAEQGRVSEYRRLAGVRAQLSALQASERWHSSWHLVTAVRSFEAATLLIAESAEVEAAVDLQAGAAVGVDLVRAGGAVNVISGRAASWSLGACTPLYEALCVRRRLLRFPRVADSYLGEQTVSPVPGKWEPVVETSRPDDLGLLKSEGDVS